MSQAMIWRGYSRATSGAAGLSAALLVAFLLAVCHPGWAQLTEADTLKFGYRLAANGSWITGNVERLLLIGAADLSTVHERWAFRSSNQYQYGTFGPFQTENDLLSRNFFYLTPRKKVYPYLMGWVERNLRRDFALRYQLGPGVTYTLARSEAQVVKASLTAAYEEARFNRDTFEAPAYDGRKIIRTYRTTLRLFGQHRLGTGRARLRYELWGQPALEDAENYRLYGDFFAELPLGKAVFFRTGFNYTYESIVLTGVKRQDTFWVFGLSVSNLKQ
jgi:hypothetical protein